MNIIWITTQFPSSVTDTKGNFIYRTVRELSKHYSITVVCLHSFVPPFLQILKDLKNAKKIYKVWRLKYPKQPKAPQNLNAKVIYAKYVRLPRDRFQNLEGWFGFRSVKKYLPSLLDKNTIIHATWLFPEGDLATLIYKKYKIPFVVTLMGSDVNYLKENSKKWQKAKKIIKNATLITSVSKALYKSLEDKNIVVPDEKRHITHTIYEFENFIIKDRNEIKQQLGFAKDIKIIFYAGTLRKLKNVDVLIEAFKLLITENSELLLLIAGMGEEEGNLIKLVKKYELDHAVKFLGGLSGNEIIYYYNAADVFCLPSQSEGTPNVVIESLLCGTPVVASKVGEVPYIIEDGKNGYTVEPGSVISLREKLSKALNIEWNREELRNSISYLSPHNVLKEYEKVYNSFLIKGYLDMVNSDKIFIEWSEYGSRTDSLAHAVGAKPIHIGKINKHRNIIYSFFTYLPKTLKNYKMIKQSKSRIVYISNTNWIIAFVNLIFSYLFEHKLVFDSHSCAFDHKFIKYPLFLSKYFAKKADLSIITNEAHYNLLTSLGAKALIISDIPFEDKLFTNEKIKLSSLLNICYICTFSADEPYVEVFEAARQNDKVKIYVTGDYKKVQINPSNYPNVHFTGFLSNEDYKKYLNNVDVIMTLTTRENTMQRAGSEAISVGKPLITSDTKMLRNYFKSGTIFVANTRNEINDGFNEAIKHIQILKVEILKFREDRKKEFSSKLKILNKILETT